MDEDDPGRAPVGSAMAERMQTLLARAAEEQLTEQRQVSLVLTDLRQLLTGIGEAVDGLSSLPGALAAVQRETSGLHDRLEALERKVDALTGLPADVAGLREGLEDLSGQERRISAHVDEAVLALAEALLRRRSATRAGLLAVVAPEGAGPVATAG